MNTCPYDRRVFHLIFARHTSGGAIYDKIKVTDCQLLAKQEEGEDDPTACEVCGQADREDRMLLCDDCDSGYVIIDVLTILYYVFYSIIYYTVI